MPNFKYDDDEERDYLDFGRAVRGRVVEAEQAPDHRWVETTDPVTVPQVDQVVAPMPDTPDPIVQVDQTQVPSGLDEPAADAAVTPAESGQE